MSGPEHPLAATTSASGPSPLARRRARVRQIRQGVTAIAVAAFIALFAVIYVQMAAGRDPALGASVTQSSTATSDDASSGTSSSGTSSTGTSSSGSYSTADDAATSDSSSDFATNDYDSTTTDEPAAVTTGQS